MPIAVTEKPAAALAAPPPMMTAHFDLLRRIDRREIDRLATHLAHLDTDGWLEQSYCTEWRVYQVVSHLASGARTNLGFLANWFDGAPPLSPEQMQGIWAHFDALQPGQMLGEFQSAVQDFFARLDVLPADAGAQEVDTFLGRQPAQVMLGFRLQEVVLHTWDVLVARDRSARLPADAMELLLSVQMQFRAFRTPALLAGKRVQIGTPDGTWQRLIDFSGEKPAVTEDPAATADIHVEAPAEEIVRLFGGRHFLPGSLPRLTWQGGSYGEVVALNVFGS